ncbi:MAG: B12-binding domain-containing radical SAM protein [Nanoarchaeota archaeon]|nr:B12-binding domain-containing radical SAM protein [Nanoarchaeota archaeon]MBU1269036.1 B12-binding domain-containing radical SAM protein [Nanoarchaeota archaeon]MBU1604068.1 B12-binding domain-containing radical SAM protein [Nanoarchaeota archaeon]MBU2442736.1 B12-binding domain-containing radical SAM protein [Nanoarchaeota archaeon]
MKICLVQCPAFGIDAPPLGVAFLATYISKNKIETKIFDFNIDLYQKVEKHHKTLWEPSNSILWSDPEKFSEFKFISSKLLDDYSAKILQFEPEMVCFSIHSTSVLFSIKLSKLIRKKDPSIKIIFGGPQCFIKNNRNRVVKTEYDIHKYADFLIIGEGEETLLEIIKRVEEKNDLKRIPGCVYECDTSYFKYRTPIMDLDNLPIIDFSFFKLEKYTDYKHHKLRILSSRGCVSKCVFCTDTMIWMKYRTRSAKNILEEFKQRKKEGVIFLEFNDSLLNGDMNNLSKLCNLLIKDNISINWGGSARIDERLSYKFLKKMRKAGCLYLNYGIESASTKILKKMNKNITTFEAIKTVILTRLAGIKVVTNWIIGFPEETRLDFLKTLFFITFLRPFISDVSVATLFINPHSLIEKQPLRFGIVYNGCANWHTIDKKNNQDIRAKRAKIFVFFTKMLFYKAPYKTI